MPKSNKLPNRNLVRVVFTADAYQRKRADVGAHILYGSSFSLQCKRLYQECVARAPLLENVPISRDVRDMTREELFYAKFLARDRDFVDVVMDVAPVLKPGDFISSKALVAGIIGEHATMPRTEMIGLGRVMRIMGWPRQRRRERDSGKLIWGYVKPEKHEIP